jgi:hypothetical protein
VQEEETGMAADHERGDRCRPRAIRRPATRLRGSGGEAPRRELMEWRGIMR